jgi:hypothetical protein
MRNKGTADRVIEGTEKETKKVSGEEVGEGR